MAMEGPRPPRGGRRGPTVTKRGLGDGKWQIRASCNVLETRQDPRGVVQQSVLGPEGALGRGAWRGWCGGPVSL